MDHPKRERKRESPRKTHPDHITPGQSTEIIFGTPKHAGHPTRHPRRWGRDRTRAQPGVVPALHARATPERTRSTHTRRHTHTHGHTHARAHARTHAPTLGPATRTHAHARTRGRGCAGGPCTTTTSVAFGGCVTVTLGVRGWGLVLGVYSPVSPLRSLRSRSVLTAPSWMQVCGGSSGPILGRGGCRSRVFGRWGRRGVGCL